MAERSNRRTFLSLAALLAFIPPSLKSSPEKPYEWVVVTVDNDTVGEAMNALEQKWGHPVNHDLIGRSGEKTTITWCVKVSAAP